MHEFKHGELKSGAQGKAGKVKSRRQAIAIALSESGVSNRQSPKRNQRNLRRTEAQGGAGQDSAAGARGQVARRRRRQAREHAGDGRQERAQADRARPQGAASRARRPDGMTRQELYARAQRKGVAGRSRMSKQQLKNALGVR